MNPKKIQQILEKYVTNAKAHITDFDNVSKKEIKASNHAADELARLRNLLQANGQLDSLKTLLTHEHKNVRCWAATHFLEVDSKKAVPVLEDLAKEEGLFGFNADMILREWRAGRLKF